MNSKQKGMLGVLVGQWTKHRKDAGLSCDRDTRLALFSRALGRTLSSSKDISGNELTELKRYILGVTQPANFDAQMKSQEDNDPAKLRADYSARIEAALYALKPDSDFRIPETAPTARNNYWSATARKMFGKPPHELTLDECRRLMGVFETRAKARARREQAAALRHAEHAGEASDSVPF